MLGEGWVLAADTVVVLDGAVLGKPEDDAEAERTLAALSGKAHEVWTGVVVVRIADGFGAEAVERTVVRFRPLDAETIRRYVATGEPRGKAGAYAIQGFAGDFVVAVDGEVSNVVGLPLRRTLALLREAGYPLPPSVVG